MIDKGNLLKWIEEKKEVYSPPYENESEQWSCKSRISILNRLKQSIELGEFDEKSS